MRACLKEYDDEDVIKWLDEIYGDVNVCGCSYSSGQLLKEVDPMRFDYAAADMPAVWVCDECGNEYDNENEANECCEDTEDEQDDANNTVDIDL